MAVWRPISFLILALCILLNASAAPNAQINEHRRRASSISKLSAPKTPAKATPIRATPVSTVKVKPTAKAAPTVKVTPPAKATAMAKATTKSPPSSANTSIRSTSVNSLTSSLASSSSSSGSISSKTTTSIGSSSTARSTVSSITSTATARTATSTVVAGNATTPGAACARPTSPGTKTKRAVAAPLPTKEGASIPNKFTVLLNANVDTKAHIAKVQQLITSTASCDTVKSTIDGTLPLNTLGIYSATLGPSMLVLLQKDADVKSVEPDVVSLLDAPVYTAQTPAPVKRVFGLFSSFTNFPDGTWNLFRVTQPGKVTPGAKGQGASVQSIDWTFRQDKNAGKGVTVYVVDSGVSPHEEFGTRLQPGFNVIKNAPNAKDSTDQFGHGTAVAGVIAGEVCGVAKAVNIVPIKITDGEVLSNYAIITGISQAITASAGKGGVINISASMSPTKSMLDAIEKALALKLHVVTTSGNGVPGTDGINVGINDCQNRVVSQPSLPVVMVGATDSTDAQAVFSNFGSCVDVFAPGQDIVVPSNIDSKGFIPGKKGTSFAAPHVSGFLASAIAKSPGLDPATGKTQLLASTVAAVQLSAGATAAKTTNKFLQIPQK